ncbi:hypothetical protein OROMI_011151 [Orobanche minor]
MFVLPFKGCTNFLVVSAGKDMDELPVADLSLCTLESKISRDGITNPIGFSPYSCSSRSGSPSATNFQSNLKTGHQSATKQRLLVAGGKDMDELPVPDHSLYTLESRIQGMVLRILLVLGHNHVLANQDPLLQLTSNQILRMDTINLLESKGSVGHWNCIAGSSMFFSTSRC